MPIAALPDVVVIELPAEHGVDATAAIESCNMVLGEGRCRAVPLPGPTPTWHASVSFQDDANLEARVEIHRGTANGPLLNVREIVFEEGDSLEQRYRALGLLIVSHVVAADPDVEPPAPPPPPPTPTPRRPPRSVWGLDAAAELGPGLEQGDLRFGGFLRGWVNPFDGPVRPIAALAWSTSSGRADATWLNGGVGLALRLEPTPELLALEVRAEGLAERLQARIEQAGLYDDDAITRFGARVGMDAHFELTNGFGVFVGGQGSYVKPRVKRFTIGDQNVGREPAPSWATFVGIRVSHWD